MGTTTNYSWPIPEDTDLVKDGAKAIRDLGNAIDTSAEDFAGGLVHIETRTVTTSSSEIFNDIFSADYDHYKAIIFGTTTTSAGINSRLRVGGVDNSTASSYVTQRGSSSGSSATADRGATAEFFLGSLHSSLKSAITVDFFQPFIATETVFLSEVLYAVDGARRSYQGGSHNQTVSYTGLNFFPTSGSITGTISIYGYRK